MKTPEKTAEARRIAAARRVAARNRRAALRTLTMLAA